MKQILLVSAVLLTVVFHCLGYEPAFAQSTSPLSIQYIAVNPGLVVVRVGSNFEIKIDFPQLDIFTTAVNNGVLSDLAEAMVSGPTAPSSYSGEIATITIPGDSTLAQLRTAFEGFLGPLLNNSLQGYYSGSGGLSNRASGMNSQLLVGGVLTSSVEYVVIELNPGDLLGSIQSLGAYVVENSTDILEEAFSWTPIGIGADIIGTIGDIFEWDLPTFREMLDGCGSDELQYPCHP